MKYFIILLTLGLVGCTFSKDSSETREILEDVLHTKIYQRGCIEGVVKIRELYNDETDNDISKDIRLEMISYCTSLKNPDKE